LVGLRDDIYLNDIWEISMTDFRRKNEHRELYSRGELKKEGPRVVGDAQVTDWVGAVYDPTSKSEVPAFLPDTTVSLARSPSGTGGTGEITSMRLSAVSSFLNRLELNRMTDAAGSKYERPLLRIFDEVVHEKAAHPIFKAYLMQQLAGVLKVRPYAWGLEYCTSLRDDLAELDRLCDNSSLRSQDWLLERKRAQFGGKLTAFFNGIQDRNYFAEAQLHREVTRGVIKAGLQFGGFIDAAGQPHLLGEARSARALWVLVAEGQKLARYTAAGADAKTTTDAAAQPEPYSPVFYVPLDREALTRTISRFLAGQSGAPAKLPANPWLDGP
jgi:hypothetical protein